MRKFSTSGVTARTKRALGAAAVAGAAGLSLSPAAALAAEGSAAAAVATATAEADAPTDLTGVDIYGERPDRPSSTKVTTAPVDTPQTVTVVSERTIRDQNLLTLRDILQTVPGITFGAGEGGGGYGDSINLRGYSANNDITTDGLRDSAQYSRTDPFNVQQIEVINGANSVYAGAGSVGGSINLVSKTPRMSDSTVISGGAGTDGYGRFSLDANRTVGDSVAVRLNVMAHQNDAPGRDVETFSRWGVAPSVTFGIDRPDPGDPVLVPPGGREHPAVRRGLRLQRLPQRAAAGPQSVALLRLPQYRHPGDRRRQPDGAVHPRIQ
jgi:catecholate siderophore receptor